MWSPPDTAGFPTGYQVGVVSKIIKKPRGMFHEIEVTPSVDYTRSLKTC